MEQWVPGQIAKAMEDSRVSDADVARYSSGNPSIIQSIRQKYRKMTTGYTFTPEVRKEILDYMKGYRLALADQIKKRATGMVPSGGGSTWTESVRTKALEEIMRPYQVPLEAGNQKGSPETIKRAEELYNKYKNSTDPDMVKRAKILAEKHGFK
jgi:DNA primase catalytic subunit